MSKSIAPSTWTTATAIAASKSKIAVIAAIVCFVPFALSCEKSKAAKASRDLAEQIVHASSPSRPVESYATAAQQCRVYLDGTISMSGFVNPASHSTFDDFLDEIGNALPGCQLYLYGEGGNLATPGAEGLTRRVGFGRDLHNPHSYNLTYNPDDRLIQSLANEETPALSVMITDGVYSDATGDTSPPVVDAIRQWIQKDRVMGILILKSAFKGPFYSERNRALMKPLAVAARPFYAFVFSPTQEEFKEMEEKLHRRFPEMQSLLFSDSAVTCAISPNDSQKWTYSSKDAPQENYYWQMFNAGLVNQNNPGPVHYDVNFHCSSNYPAAEFKLNVTGEYYRWEGRSFKKVSEGPPMGFEAKAGGDPQPAYTEDKVAGTGPSVAYASEQSRHAQPIGSDSAFPQSILSVRFIRDADSNYGFYHLALHTAVKSLRPWIMDLSTRDDSVPENASKTYRFFELIAALTDVHFKIRLGDKTSPSLFVTVTNH